MRKLPILLWLVIVVGCAFGLYMVKYKVQGMQKEIADLNKQLDEERESLRVVAAEWAYLTRPERLQMLSGKYLELKQMQSTQMTEVATIPYPQTDVAADAPVVPVSAVANHVPLAEQTLQIAPSEENVLAGGQE